MKGLVVTYVLKIVITLVFWCLPLLFFGEAIRGEMDIQQPVVDYLFMLLGWAYVALCVGYGVGLFQLLKYKQVNQAPIFAGIASNGGAALLLTLFLLNSQNQLNECLLYFLLISALGAALVTLSLVYYLIMDKTSGLQG